MRSAFHPLLLLTVLATISCVAHEHRSSAGRDDFDKASATDAAALIRDFGEPSNVPPFESRGGGIPEPPSAPLMDGTNLLINDPTRDTPESTTQNETALAVRGSTVCAAYNDVGKGLVHLPAGGFSRSDNGGTTWKDRGPARSLLSDPALAVHTGSGRFYYAAIAALGSSIVGIGVAASTDDCQSFSTPKNASPDGKGGNDKPWIAVDNSGGVHDGTVYVCFSNVDLRFTRSTDAGASFSDEQVLSGATDFGPIGCQVAVGPSGEVDVAWSDRGADASIQFRRSLDGGLTWESPVQVNASPIRQPGLDRIVGKCGTTLNGDVRTFPFLSMGVDTTGGPYDGNIYVVWQSDPPGSIDNSDVWLSRSSDGGLTWAPEVQIGGGTVTDQFQPVVAVGGSGTASVAWYDRRNDPNHNYRIDVYATFSRDGGATFEPLVRLTNVSFGVPPLLGQPTSSGNFEPYKASCYMGDYIAAAADALYFYYAWGDNRNTVVSATYPNGRPDPDVFFTRRLVSCGDNVLDPLEECDDGNLIDADGCDSNCTPTGCGNGVVTAGEQCDDGNLVDGDGCDSLCELGVVFTPTPTRTAIPTAAPDLCVGDCDSDGAVTIDELIRGVNIDLGSAPISTCPSLYGCAGGVDITCLVRAVDNALNGCGGRAPTPLPSGRFFSASVFRPRSGDMPPRYACGDGPLISVTVPVAGS